jgi:glucosyl-3-phosphoglycerate synthase
MKKHVFSPFRRALVPVAAGRDSPAAALAAARAVADEVILVGIVIIPSEETLSAGASQASALRKRLRELARGEPRYAKTSTVVSHQPWDELVRVIAAEKPDLLVLEWDQAWTDLGVSPGSVLARPPCDVALVRGPFPAKVSRVLAPMRGGPNAELALRLSLSLHASAVTALHLTPPVERGAHTDAPFRGLEQVLKRLPEVRVQSAITADAGQTILEQASGYDLVVMGVTAHAARSPGSLGTVADQVWRDSLTAVMAVKSRRPMPSSQMDETAGTRAISILVDKWFAENTFEAGEWADVQHLVALKESQKLTISLALPALNEEATVERVIETVKRALMEEAPLLDEIVLMDSDSTDRTREIAAGLGVPVHIHQQLLPELGPRRGKGEALWKSLLVTRGDLIAWIDTDVVNIDPRFVYGIVGPLLLAPHIQLVKGFYRRPLRVGDALQAGGGGRVTELMARPLLNLYYPELSGIIQPLSGEYAGRRSALEQLPFYSGYGVEIGLLIDVFEKYGLEGIAQVDLLERVHHNQPLENLSKMSFAVLQAVMGKLERRHGRRMREEVNKSMKLIRYTGGSYFLDVEEMVERERPPMVEVAEYQARSKT